MVIGTIGYMVIEGMSLVDAFYMTAITVSTVGFGEVDGELTSGGKIFTVGVIIFGMGGALYTAAVGIERGVDRLLGGERKRRRMESQIEDLSGHIVLCGFGRVGSTTWEELTSRGVRVVVIESAPPAAAEAREAGALVVEGDATHDGTLTEAKIDAASALISAVRDDSDNLVITLTAKARRPEMLVVARVVEAENERKLYLAGADRVVAPQQVGGERLAALALHPDLAEFIDLVVRGRTLEFRVAEYHVPEDAPIVGSPLAEATDTTYSTGSIALAVVGGGTTPVVATFDDLVVLLPDPDVQFEAGSVVVGFGTQEQLDGLGALMSVAVAG